MGAGKYYLVLAIVAGILCAPAAGETELPTSVNKPVLIGPPNPALAGLERLSVVIVPTDSEPNEDGLVWKKLHVKICNKLGESNIKIIAGIAGNILEIPELQICVDMLKFDGSQQYVFRIQTSLAIKVSLENKRQRYLKAVVWKVGSGLQAVSVQDMPAAVTDEVCREVDAFIIAWRQANRASGKAAGAITPAVSKKQRQRPAAKAVEAEYKCIASKNSKVFHKADCSSAKRIKPENIVKYGSRAEAIKAGKRPCKRCKP